MNSQILDRYDRRVPRYTSYPTANHFHAGIDARVNGDWLDAVADVEHLSLYAHIPFCESMCWFCGCHTKIVRRHAPVSVYLEALLTEIETVARRVGRGPRVSHVHWGGGTPTILEPQEIERLATALRGWFRFEDSAEFAVEIDPRRLVREAVTALARSGVNRASLGVQDLTPEVQLAVNRVQPLELTRRVVEWLRADGIEAINVDLMYGLPGQDEARVRDTIGQVLALEPQRVSLFGYAHVPWMKRHQEVLGRLDLPDRDARWAQYHAAFEALTGAGYVAIGLDHFAVAHDSLARALGSGALRRNFQGYTVDAADALIGFGASAISDLGCGYVQNEANIARYLEVVEDGALATARGVESTPGDALRRAVIEALMCQMTVDAGQVSARFGYSEAHLDEALDAAATLVEDGLVSRVGRRLTVAPAARPLLRSVCALFDERLAEPAAPRHAQAV